LGLQGLDLVLVAWARSSNTLSSAFRISFRATSKFFLEPSTRHKLPESITICKCSAKRDNETIRSQLFAKESDSSRHVIELGELIENLKLQD
jgi:hypothetical protein